MSKINDFINEAGVFFLATVDGNRPKVRPLGAHFEEDGKIYFTVGDFKDVYKQLCENPLVEIVAYKDWVWLRYTGRAVFDDNPEYAEKFLEALPNLRNVYNETTGNKMMVFHLEDAEANLIDMSGNKTTLL